MSLIGQTDAVSGRFSATGVNMNPSGAERGCMGEPQSANTHIRFVFRGVLLTTGGLSIGNPERDPALIIDVPIGDVQGL